MLFLQDIPSILNVFITVFIQAWTLASINEYESTNDKTFYSNMFNFFQILILLICLVIIALIKPFMSIYVGEEYFESWIYVPLLLLSSCLSGFTSFFGTFYTITQKSKDVMITTIIASIINVIFNYIFMMLIGVWGAVIGTIASYFVITIIRMVDVYKEFKFSYHLKSLILNFSIVSLTIILIIFDVNIYICSIIAIIVYCILNFKSIKNLTEFMVKNLKMYFKKFFKEKV